MTMSSFDTRIIYSNNQLGEVICQLRFPEILSIETTLPAAFQDAIRDIFPRYRVTRETAAPQLMGKPGAMQVKPQEQTNNYQFATEDGIWRVNLTSKFISLSTNRYTRWEDFAAMLDKPLAAFIQIYKPACFDRVGLRYLNFISRKALELEDTPFRDLIQPAYVGILGQEIPEGAVTRSGVDGEFIIGGGCKCKLHAGPGKVTIGGNADPEVKFIIDMDLFTTDKVPVNYSAGALQTLHNQAFGIFRSAITDQLHEAMQPQ